MKMVLCFVFMVLIGCKKWKKLPDGREYYTTNVCLEYHWELETGFHWGGYVGYNPATNTVAYHYGLHWPWQCFNAHRRTVCDIYSRIDTTFKKVAP